MNRFIHIFIFALGVSLIGLPNNATAIPQRAIGASIVTALALYGFYQLSTLDLPATPLIDIAGQTSLVAGYSYSAMKKLHARQLLPIISGLITIYSAYSTAFLGGSESVLLASTLTALALGVFHVGDIQKTVVSTIGELCLAIGNAHFAIQALQDSYADIPDGGNEFVTSALAFVFGLMAIYGNYTANLALSNNFS